MRANIIWVASPLLFVLLFPSVVSAAQETYVVGLNGNAKRGKALYQRYCIQCHGARGDGKGDNAAHLDPKPQDFSVGAIRSDSNLYEVISRGIRSTAMPSWNPLTRQERVDLVAYLKNFSGDSKNRNSSLVPAKSVGPSAAAPRVDR